MAGPDEGVAAPHPVPGHPDEVHRQPPAGCGGDNWPIVALQASHPNGSAAGHDHQLVVDAHAPVEPGPGDHGARTPGGERPVDPQPGSAAVDGEPVRITAT